MTKDYYNILGVAKNASAEEIRKIYYKLAHQHHPHKGGDEAKMKEINEAYSVLGNPEKRQQYDQYGATFEQARTQGGFGGFEGFRDFSDFAQAFRSGGNNNSSFSFEFGDLGDIFGDLFSGGGRTRTKTRQRQGADIQAEINIDFNEAIFGNQKTINFERHQLCQICGGKGAEPGSKVKTCQTCGGTGQVLKNIGFGLGFPSVCPDCQGEGKKPEKFCHHCRGKGVINQTENLTVKIPAGIDHGQAIRLEGKGHEAGKGSAAGDLYLKIRVRPDARFKRDSFNIITKAEISFTQAALGGKIEIDTVEGKVNLKIPEGTQSGKIFKLSGKGVPHLGGRGRGDQFIEIIVKTPTRLSKKQRELLRELED